VAGWSRSPKDIDGVRCFAGVDAFHAFLVGLDIAVCLLPLTEETRGIIDRRALAALPEGACLINAGRGPQVVERDLLAALDTGRLEAAALDVFEIEPLRADHPFWTHPKVIVTPHIASQTSPDTAAPEIAANIRRIRDGRAPFPIADREREY
jgi:glyoxylate/hydroxypyruvate reductase A